MAEVSKGIINTSVCVCVCVCVTQTAVLKCVCVCVCVCVTQTAVLMCECVCVCEVWKRLFLSRNSPSVCFFFCVCARTDQILFLGVMRFLSRAEAERVHSLPSCKTQPLATASFWKPLKSLTVLHHVVCFPPLYETLLLKWIVSVAAARCSAERGRER